MIKKILNKLLIRQTREFPSEPERGRWGEDYAADYLRRRGWKIISRNYTNRHGRKIGELDIVAEKDGEIYFVEVKTRKISSDEVLPEEAVNFRKLQSLEKVAQIFLRENGLEDRNVHFDVLALSVHSPEKVAVKHLRDVFL